MKDTLNRNSIALFISVLFITQMYFGGIVLPGLFENYPEIGANVIMLFYTLPLLVNGFLGLALGPVIAKANKKLLVIAGLAIIGIGGILIVTMGAQSFGIALAGSVLCGIGGALTQNASTVLLSMANPEKTSVLAAMNNAVMSLGSMVSTTVGGMLAETHWTRMYLVCFPAFVTMVIFIFLYRSQDAVQSAPAADVEERAEAPVQAEAPARHTGIFILTVVIFFFCMMNQAAFLSNYSIYLITEKGIGTTTQAGLISTIGGLGGMISGLFLVGMLLPKLKSLAVPFGLALLLLPNLSIVLGTNSWVLIAVLNFVSMAGLSFVFGPVMGAGAKAFGPAALTTITAEMGLVNFAGPYIINFIVGTSAPVGMKSLVGLVCAIAGIIIAIPAMRKADAI